MRIVKRTWLVTALMIAPIVGIELLDPNHRGWHQGFLIGDWWTMPLIGAVITPCVWWALVVRAPGSGWLRGIFAGVVSAALTLLIPSLVIIAEVFHSGPRERGFGAIAIGAIVFFWPWGLALGGVFGAVAATVQKRTPPAASHPFRVQ